MSTLLRDYTLHNCLMLRSLLLLVIILPLAASLLGQSCTISLKGQVFDGSPDHPLEYANVYLEEAEQGAYTKEDGSFELANLCPGAYHLRVTHLGCHPERIYLDLQADTTIRIALEHHATTLEYVEVSAAANQNIGQSSQELSQEVLEREAGQNLGNMVEQIAGLSVIRNGSGISKPVIHGLTGNRIAILNNGIVQAGQQWGVDHAPEIDPFTADRISVIKGVESIAYGGNTLGGAVLVEPGDISNDPHLHGAAQYVLETNGRGHTLNTRLEKSGKWADWRVVGTLKYSGDRHTPDYYLRNTGVRERNVAAMMQKEIDGKWYNTLYYSYFNTNLGILRGAHIGNTTDLESAIGRAEPFFTEPEFTYGLEQPRQAVQHHLLKYKGSYYLTANQHIQLTYAGQLNQRQEFDVRRGGRSDRPALDLNLFSHFVDAFWQSEEGRLRTKVGLQFRFTDNENQAGTGVLPLLPDYELINPAVYAMISSAEGKIHQWQLGGRYDFVTMDIAAISQDLPRRVLRFSHDFHNYSLAAGWQYRPAKQWRSKLNLGVVQRSPEVNELYSMGLHQGVASIEEGNAGLVPEISAKASWTNTVELNGNFIIDATAYYQLVNDFIYLQPQAENRLTIRGAFPLFIYQQNDARLAGLDLSTTWQWNEQWEWQNRFAMVRGRELDNDVPLVYMPSDNLLSRISFTGKDAGWLSSPELSISVNYVFEQTRLLPEQDFLAPPPAYFLLHASAGTSFNWGGNTLHCTVLVRNVLNERYRDYLNRLRYYADEEGRNVRLNVRLEF